MNEVDIVISATSSPHTVITKEDMPLINRNICMIDIAVPRDIDEELNNRNNIQVYDIDDLKDIHNKNDETRKKLADEGYKIILDKICEFEEWMESVKIDPTIQSLNRKCADIKEDTLEYIIRKVDLDSRDRKIVDKMLTSALRRLVREPILNLKQVKNQGKREEYIKIIEELFEI